jgi:hypothetical protein
MNFAESLAYWYLRFNGFFPITDFVLHRLDGDAGRQTADCDLLAVRLPHVYEKIGGQAEDWDTHQFNEWGITLSTDTVGLMVEVKSGRPRRADLNQDSFAEDRWKRAVQRFGFWPQETAELLAQASHGKRSHRPEGESFVVAKILIANGIQSNEGDRWHLLRLSKAECFLVQRMRRYERKQLDRMYFPDGLAQYLAWKYGGKQLRAKGAVKEKAERLD